jgi:hypothetical protein
MKLLRRQVSYQMKEDEEKEDDSEKEISRVILKKRFKRSSVKSRELLLLLNNDTIATTTTATVVDQFTEAAVAEFDRLFPRALDTPIDLSPADKLRLFNSIKIDFSGAPEDNDHPCLLWQKKNTLFRCSFMRETFRCRPLFYEYCRGSSLLSTEGKKLKQCCSTKGGRRCVQPHHLFYRDEMDLAIDAFSYSITTTVKKDVIDKIQLQQQHQQIIHSIAAVDALEKDRPSENSDIVSDFGSVETFEPIALKHSQGDGSLATKRDHPHGSRIRDSTIDVQI